MRTLVTGATGLLGNNVVRVLLEQGHTVRVLTRSASNPQALAGLDIETVLGDVRQPESLATACQGIETVVHSAAHVHIGWSGRQLQQEINVTGTGNVARAARQAGARLIHVSSVDALGLGSPEQPADEETPFGAPPVACPYVVTKRASEQQVLAEVDQGLDAVIVNPGFMLGPWDWKPSSGRMLLEVARGWALLAPRGSNEFCDARDVAAGVVSAIQRGRTGTRYILGGQSLTYQQAWHTMAEAIGARKPLGTAGPVVTWLAGQAGDWAYRIMRREPDVNSAAVAMSRLPKYFTCARAEQELDYRWRSLSESARDTWHWFCKYGYVQAKK